MFYKCFLCGKEYEGTKYQNSRRRYCGSARKKIGCSYVNQLKKVRAWFKANPDYFPNYRKKQQ